MTLVFLFLRKNVSTKNLVAVPQTNENNTQKYLKIFLNEPSKKKENGEKQVSYECFSLDTKNLPTSFYLEKNYIVCPDKTFELSTETFWGNSYDDYYIIKDLEKLWKKKKNVTLAFTLEYKKKPNDTWYLSKYLYDNIENFEYETALIINEFLTQAAKNNYPSKEKLSKKMIQHYNFLEFFMYEGKI